MANQEHLNLLKQGVKTWNKWREGHPDVQPDLTDANLAGIKLSEINLKRANLIASDLAGANLSGANLSEALLQKADLSPHYGLFRTILRNADLSRADLSQADLRSADLSKANLSRAILGNGDWLPGQGLNRRGANLSFADLSFANLREAGLFATDLSGTSLSQADLSGAIVEETIFAQMDLRNTKGLAEIVHQGPSHVALNTVQLPNDGCAVHFLRGVGLSDEWIHFYCSTMMYPILYHSCFISYSSKDEVLARSLYSDLQARGIRCWFAPEDMKIGDKIRASIDEAIHLHDKLLLLLSEHAIASTWVEDEVEAALEKEQRQQREVLFPIRLDESVMQTSQAWAAKLRRARHIGDFTHWTDPQKYQQAFERLLRDLKAERNTEDGKDGKSRIH
jgi:uncharacterized protein YjbI with pentapeptide repeats